VLFKRNHPKIPVQFGLREFSKDELREKNLTYGCTGRLKQTKAFLHTITCQPFTRRLLEALPPGRVNDGSTAMLIAQRNERRTEIISAIAQLLGSPPDRSPNYIFTITVQPNIGKELLLFACPVRIDVQGRVNRAIACTMGDRLKKYLERTDSAIGGEMPGFEMMPSELFAQQTKVNFQGCQMLAIALIRGYMEALGISAIGAGGVVRVRRVDDKGK
jgi:hypothetical protein